MNKHFYATLLATTLVLTTTTGCGLMVVNDLSGENILLHNKNIVSGETTETKEAETVTPFTPYTEENRDTQIERYLSALPELTFDGATVFITSPSFSYLEPDTLDTPVSQKAYERNRMLEERYAISLSTSTRDASTMLTEMQDAVASGTYYSDLVMMPLYTMGQFKSGAVLENLRSLPYLDLEKPYFYQSSVDALSAGYTTWGVSGYASVTQSDFTAVYMNKDLIDNAMMDLPYDLVEEGTWTWDAFYSYVQAVQTMNANGSSFYTVTSQNPASRLADLVFVSCDNKYVLSGEKLIPSISFTAESAATAIEYASRIFADEKSITDPSAGAIGCFSRGESLFLIDYTYVTTWLTNASVDWGILPLPKLTESGKYQTLVSNSTLCFGVPAGTVNTELSSILLSAINAASWEVLNDAYVEHSMIYTLRDNDSVNMLDMILDTATFDFALAFGTSYPNMAAGTYQLIRETAAAGAISANFEDKTSKANMILAEYFPMEITNE